MRLPALVPHAAVLFIGQAVLDAAPVIVAEREGGMGLGSALIAARVVQVAGLAAGASLAAWVVDRRSASLALVVGSLVCYVGLLATGTAPMGALGWLLLAQGMAGIGFGFVLAAAFSAAAAIAPGPRPWAIVILLLALLVARSAIGILVGLGPLGLVAAGAGIVGISVIAARVSGEPLVLGEPRPSRIAGGRFAVAGVLVGVGALLAASGAEPSGLSGALLGGLVGVNELDVLNTARLAMTAAGVLLVLAGLAALLARRAAEPPVRWSAMALGLASFAGAGVVSAMSLVTTAGRVDASVAVGAASLAGGLLGLGVAGWWLGSGREWRAVAGWGGGLLILVSVLAFLMLSGDRPAAGDLGPVGLMALTASAIALAAAALRLALAEAPVDQRGLAAACGVVAAAIGATLGSMVGSGLAIPLVVGEQAGIPAPAGALVAAALVAAVIVLALVRPIRWSPRA